MPEVKSAVGGAACGMEENWENNLTSVDGSYSSLHTQGEHADMV